MSQHPTTSAHRAAHPGGDTDSFALDYHRGSHREFPEGSRFRDVTFLGEGGMGCVYRAEDPDLGRTVALKIANDDSDMALMRFTSEAQAQARIDHPNVVKVFEVGEVQGTPFIVMQFVQGMDLAQAQERLGLRQLVRIMQQVAEGTEAAHRLGLLHRDLKPQNILVEGLDTAEPHPLLTDFGLVKDMDAQGLTATGVAMGTPRYMSPEQAVGDRHLVDVRSDVYSLGATMYEVFGGGPLYGDLSNLALLHRISMEDPAPLRRMAPGLPEDLAVIVHTCLARDPDRRYPSAQALAEDLGRFLAGRPIWARRPSLAYRAQRLAQQHRPLVVLGSVGLAALLVLGTWSLVSLARSRRQAALALEFGQRAQRMETILRLAYMSPEHPIRGHLATVTQEITQLRAAMHQGGTIAEGPGNWALGEGYLALGNLDEALRCLDRAWAIAYRTPESASTRGRILVQKYLAAKYELPGIHDRAKRQAELNRIEARFKTPALEMLKQSRALPGAGALLAAQIAMLEGRQDDALRESVLTLQNEPWRYEACLLQMQIWKERGEKALAENKPEDARSAHENLEKAFERARTIAPSDPVLWTQFGTECLDHSNAQATLVGASNAGAWLEKAKASYDHALALDPNMVVALNNRSEVAWRSAFLTHMAGKDPEPFLRQAVADAEASLHVDPGQSRCHLALCRALILRASLLVDMHQEAGPDLQRCLLSLRTAIQRIRSTGAVLPWEAFDGSEPQILALQGANARNHGQDGRPMFREALALVRAMMAAEPDSVLARGLCGSIAIMLADVEDRSGDDPGPTLDLAQKAFGDLIRMDPQNPQVLRDSAEVHRLRASFLVRGNADPAPELEQTQALLAKGLAAAPGFHELHQVKGRAAMVQARWDRHRGRSGTASLALARAALLKAKALNPRIADLDADLRDLDQLQRH